MHLSANSRKKLRNKCRHKLFPRTSHIVHFTGVLKKLWLLLYCTGTVFMKSEQCSCYFVALQCWRHDWISHGLTRLIVTWYSVAQMSAVLVWIGWVTSRALADDAEWGDVVMLRRSASCDANSTLLTRKSARSRPNSTPTSAHHALSFSLSYHFSVPPTLFRSLFSAAV